VKRKFLGYQIISGETLAIARKSIERLKDKIRKITRRNRGVSLEQVIREINIILPGWIRYFKLAKAETTVQRIDAWIRRKLRCYRLKQFKRAITIATNLIDMGISRRSAWKVANSGKGWWRLSHTPQLDKAMSVAWFEDQGLCNLEKMYKSL